MLQLPSEYLEAPHHAQQYRARGITSFNASYWHGSACYAIQYVQECTPLHSRACNSKGIGRRLFTQTLLPTACCLLRVTRCQKGTVPCHPCQSSEPTPRAHLPNCPTAQPPPNCPTAQPTAIPTGISVPSSPHPIPGGAASLRGPDACRVVDVGRQLRGSLSPVSVSLAFGQHTPRKADTVSPLYHDHPRPSTATRGVLPGTAHGGNPRHRLPCLASLTENAAPAPRAAPRTYETPSLPHGYLRTPTP